MAESNDGQESFDSLLAEMPRIAEAVKAFPEAVQPKAFEALMAELTGRAAPRNTTDKTTPKRRTSKATLQGQESDKKGSRRRTGTPSAIRELDLTPDGKPSLKEFVQEKQPKTNHDKNVVSVYYLAEILELDGVTVNHVFTCYKDMNWREPANLANNLALTASRKRFLNTAKFDAINLTPAGRNHVQHDLPSSRKGKT